jgi:hypothetical protein
MTEKKAEIDQLKGATLEEISSMVESINREFKTKQQQLQPLIAELKVIIIIYFVYLLLLLFIFFEILLQHIFLFYSLLYIMVSIQK